MKAHQVPGAAAFLNVQLEETVVGIQDVQLPVTPSDTQRTPAFNLIVQGQIFRLRLRGRPVSVDA